MLVLLVLAVAVRVTRTEWPQNMQRKGFMYPGLIYLPKENKTFVLGGKLHINNGKSYERLTDVAVIDLSQQITSNNNSCAAVSTASFSLPHASFRQPTLVIDNGNGAYEAFIYSHGDDVDSTHVVWQIPDLLNAQPKVVPQPNPAPEIYFPGWASASKPLKPSEAASYFFGNTSANGTDVSPSGNGTLWKMTKDGITAATVDTKTRPPAGGWGTMVQYGSSVVLIVGTEIWAYNTVASTWYQREKGLNAERYDATSVLFETPTRTRYAIVIGAAAKVEYFDVDAPKNPLVEAIITGDGPEHIEAAVSMFLHDSHIFMIGGLTGSGDSQSSMLLNIVKISASSDWKTLSFAYVPTYTPYAPETSSTSRTDGDSGLPIGLIIGIVVGSLVALLVLAGLIFWHCRRHPRRRRDSKQGPVPAITIFRLPSDVDDDVTAHHQQSMHEQQSPYAHNVSVPPTHFNWPMLVTIPAQENGANMQRKGFMYPGLIYLPKENKTFVLGGKLRINNGKSHEAITDVAVIDLNQQITSNNNSCAAVSTAPFALPLASFRHPTLVIDNGNGAYEALIYSHGDNETGTDNIHVVWQISDLLSARPKVVPQPNPAPIFFPGWVSASKPLKPSEAASYFFGNTSANGTDVSPYGNDTLWKMTKEGIVAAPVSTKTRPPAGGWGTMVQYGSSVVLVVGTEIWTYNTVSYTWYQRETSLNAERYDATSVLFETPTRTRFVIVIGAAAKVEYFDVDSPKNPPAEAVIEGDGPEHIEAAVSMFLHDSHIFMIGGLTGSGDSQSSMLLNIVKISASSDWKTLSFAYVPTYTPYALETLATNRTIVEPDRSGVPIGEIVGIAVGSLVAVIAIAGLVYWHRQRRRRARDAKRGRANMPVTIFRLPSDMDDDATAVNGGMTDASMTRHSSPGRTTVSFASYYYQHPPLMAHEQDRPHAHSPSVPPTHFNWPMLVTMPPRDQGAEPDAQQVPEQRDFAPPRGVAPATPAQRSVGAGPEARPLFSSFS
ncbi:hypothetical protein GGF32_006964 [Allomyces javanicus]|nr:hypothetical protein GGF32_006964 [Allomyces javanicus]